MLGTIQNFSVKQPQFGLKTVMLQPGDRLEVIKPFNSGRGYEKQEYEEYDTLRSDGPVFHIEEDANPIYTFSVGRMFNYIGEKIIQEQDREVKLIRTNNGSIYHELPANWKDYLRKIS